MVRPSVVYRTHALPREGADEASYEDAAAVTVEPWPVCAAVADGATESVFARTWAKRLVRGLVQGGGTTAEAFRDAVPAWQAEWQEAVGEHTADRPWYVEAKAAEGAFAAVLGLSLHADGRWRAVSVGDCCLFHLSEGALARSWPFQDADAFTHRPALVSSRPDRAVPPPDVTTGAWHPGDWFLLATDAVAAWLLEVGPHTVAGLEADPLRQTIEAARAEGALRNDDATILVLELSASPEADEDASDGS